MIICDRSSLDLGAKQECLRLNDLCLALGSANDAERVEITDTQCGSVHNSVYLRFLCLTQLKPILTEELLSEKNNSFVDI